MRQPLPLDYARPLRGSSRMIKVLLIVCGAGLALLVGGWGGSRALYARGQARVSAAQQAVTALQLAVDAFAKDAGRYPTTAEGLAALVQPPPGVGRWRGPYLRRNPGADPWGNAYAYRETGGMYCVFSAGPDGKPGTADDMRRVGPLSPFPMPQ